jgi:hypothetical protein
MLSKTQKLDGISSWSLIAGDHCPGMHNQETGLIAAVCAGCYAKSGNYHRPSVRAVRLHNAKDWYERDWEKRMVEALEGHDYFRWFDSGDMYTLSLARKILRVMERTSNTKHWIATRMGKFRKFTQVLEAMRALPNVSVRYSADDIGAFGPEHSCMVFDPSEPVPAGVKACNSYVAEGDKVAKCHGCRDCWDKTIPVIGYKAHGRRMIKLLEV